MPMGTLYLVATPIGNLEDITLRALRVLKEVSLVAAEDTRSARRLLSHFGIHVPVTSYFEHNKLDKLPAILEALQNGDVGVISEAGLPGLSDPGYELVRAALDAGVRVVPIPGPNALTTALVASGLPTDQFTYLGFMPRQHNARLKLLQSVAFEPRTLIIYEAPHRILDTLEDISAALGNRPVCIARELTKLYEEFYRGSVQDALEYFRAHPPRGEFTIVIGGNTGPAEAAAETEATAWDDARVLSAVRDLIATGLPRPQAVKRVAQISGRDRQEVYRLSNAGEK